MRGLTAWTAGLVGEREPAQPLLTLHAPGRVELSGATTANWVAKSANLLVDGLGAPAQVGLLLPLHWQTVVLVLAGAATGARVVVAADAGQLAGCDAAFVLGEHAEAALDAGVDEVLALSGHPFGTPLPSVPALVTDYAREVPGHGDHWGGPARSAALVEAGGAPLPTLPALGLGPADRVLVAGDPADPALLAGLLAATAAGGALVLAPEPHALDLPSVVASEAVTCTLGLALDGVRDLSER